MLHTREERDQAPDMVCEEPKIGWNGVTTSALDVMAAAYSFASRREYYKLSLYSTHWLVGNFFVALVAAVSAMRSVVLRLLPFGGFFVKLCAVSKLDQCAFMSLS